jgi:hypothetical protein
MKSAIFAIALSFILNLTLHGQQTIGFELQSKRPSITLPFTLVNNLIILPVTIDNRITLKFIFDTGANNPILTERLFADMIEMEFNRNILISGPGIYDSIQAFVASDISFNLGAELYGQHLSLLVLDEDYIELEKNLGEDIYGIIGYDLFSRFVVRLDYDNLEATFYDPKRFKKPRGYHAFKLDMRASKPYIKSLVSQKNRVDTMELMVDTGASHALLLDIDQSKVIARPDSTLETSLGHGLGGEIPGKIGRLSEFQMGFYEMGDILVSIPDPGAYSNSIKRGSRHGTIGGAILKKLNPILDYHNGYIYLKKGNSFKEPFSYDMSGLRISYMDDPERFEISGLTENSPAELAGLQVGDVVKDINGRNIFDDSLSSIYTLLKSRENKKIKVNVIRNGIPLQFEFRLRKMI